MQTTSNCAPLVVAMALVASASACSEPADEECWDRIPDITGDGSRSQADCDAVAAGSALKHICTTSDIWRSVDACAMQVEDPLTDGKSGNIQPVWRGESAPDEFVVWTDGKLVSWTAPPAGDHFGWQRLESADMPAEFRVGIATATVVTGSDQMTWLDRNRDRVLDAGELVNLAEELGHPFGTMHVIETDSSLVVVIGSRVWNDVDGDRFVDAGEVVSLPSDALEPMGVATDAVFYRSFAAPRVWYWDSWPPPTASFFDLPSGSDCLVFTSWQRFSRTAQCLDMNRRLHEVSFEFIPREDLLSTLRMSRVTAGIGQTSTARADVAVWISEDVVFELPLSGDISGEATRRLRGEDESTAEVLGVVNVLRDSVIRLVGVKRSRALRFLGDACSDIAPCAMTLRCRNDSEFGSYCGMPNGEL